MGKIKITALVFAAAFLLCPATLLAATAVTFAELQTELSNAIAAGGPHTINITNLDATYWTSAVSPNNLNQDV